MSKYTKKAIIDTFIELLGEKPLDKITVKDIVERCEINRGTFYYYYADIYALIEDIFENEVLRIAGDHTTYDTWQEKFLEATQLAKKDKKMLYHAYHSVSREKLERYLYRISGQLMREFVDREAEGLLVSEEDKDVISQFYTCALVGLVSRWLDGGMKENPEIYINKFGELFEGNIQRALEKADRRHRQSRS